jgi:hypothetical protein
MAWVPLLLNLTCDDYGFVSCEYLESKVLPKVLKACRADPIIEIFGAITLMQSIRYFLSSKFGPAKFAMVMIPLLRIF